MSYLDIAFENYGSFCVTLSSTNGSTVTFSPWGLNDCIVFIEQQMKDERIERAFITDSETGEIVAIVTRKDK